MKNNSYNNFSKNLKKLKISNEQKSLSCDETVCKMFVIDFRKYKTIGIRIGITSAIAGIVSYEYYQLQRQLNTLVNSNVLNLGSKHPDYIYIKYHIYKESMLQRKHEELEGKKWINVIVHPIGNWWKTIKHSIAWRLLEVAKNGDYHERLKAVRQLARIDHLKDWDYQHLAQICDARTAISLARYFSDTRWFLPPANFGALREPKSLITEIRDHLNRLSPCACLQKFNSNIFDDFNILKDYKYTNRTSNGISVSRQEYDFLRKCLEALYHLTQENEISETLIQQGFLQTLMEILKLFHADVNLRFLLAKIVANFSVCHGHYNDFFVTGWIGVLSRWTRNPDIRIQATAAKALANLDVDDIYPNEYRTKVYPLYPLIRAQKPQLDVIFIHGLLGGVFVTWRQKDPKEPELGLYESMTYSEDTLISRKPKNIAELKISDIATKEFLEALESIDALPDWEVVFPDCPLKSERGVNNMFSVPGSKWVNDDQNSEYTFCWPMDWLPQEYPNIRIIGLNYETSISEWSLNMMCPCEKNKSSLHDRSRELMNSLIHSNVGQYCPVVWVGHSMGGLVAKSIIVQSLESDDPKKRAIAENTRAILFLGTPHKGSPVAKLKQHVEMIFSPTIEVKELQENSQLLLDLHAKFVETLIKLPKPIQIVSIAEGCPTNITSFKFPMQFVTEESAKLNIGEFYVLNVDHLGLSKPIFRQSFLYQRLLKIIDDVIQTAMKDAAKAKFKVQKHESGFEKLSHDQDAIM